MNLIFNSKASLLLLFIMSLSVMLATIFYPYDKALVIHFNAQRNDFWDTVFLTITNSAGIISYGTVVVLFFASIFIKSRTINIKFCTIGIAGIVSGLTVLLVKSAITRIRPFHLFSVIHPLGPGGGWSYPSGHTSDAFFLAAILKLVYPERKILLSTCYFWAVLVGVSRVYLGVHYPSDVLGGVAISSASSWATFTVISLFISRKALIK